MRSNRPKTLQELGGQPMIRYIVNCARSAEFDRIHIVHGENGLEIKRHVTGSDINWVLQSEPLGTGHAAQQAIAHVDADSTVCILYGDIPFIQPQTVTKLVELANTHSLALLTVELEKPTGYGRIKRDENGVLIKIIEEKDTTQEEQAITEVNAGPVAVKVRQLARWLSMLDNNNSQNEYYLTDIIEIAVSESIQVATLQASQPDETAGVNSRTDQARLERKLQMKLAENLMQTGVQIVDPSRFDLRGECNAGKDCRIDVNVIIEGSVELEDNVNIESNNIIRDSTLGSGVTIRPHCLIEGARIAAGCTIGPFARLRPGTVIGKNSKVGNYVEIKSSTIGENSKINHHAYVGNAEIGSNVNIGAGVITCNYDGREKHTTIIGDNVFVGANSSLIAPLEIQADAKIGAGSAISKNVNRGELVVERSKTRTYKRKQKGSA